MNESPEEMVERLRTWSADGSLSPLTRASIQWALSQINALSKEEEDWMLDAKEWRKKATAFEAENVELKRQLRRANDFADEAMRFREARAQMKISPEDAPFEGSTTPDEIAVDERRSWKERLVPLGKIALLVAIVAGFCVWLYFFLTAPH
jgi:hypothetical protein